MSGVYALPMAAFADPERRVYTSGLVREGSPILVCLNRGRRRFLVADKLRRDRFSLDPFVEHDPGLDRATDGAGGRDLLQPGELRVAQFAREADCNFERSLGVA